MYQITSPKHLKRNKSGWSWMFIFFLHFSHLAENWLSRSELAKSNRQIPAMGLLRLPLPDQAAFLSVIAVFYFSSQYLITANT